MCGAHQANSASASSVKRSCQTNPPSRDIQLHLENSWKLQNRTWTYKPLKTGREGFPVLQAGRNVREIQLKAQPAKVWTFGAHSAPDKPQHREMLGKPLPQLLIRGSLGLESFWCNWAGQAIEFLSIHCIKITHPTVKIQWQRHLIKQQYWLRNIFELLKLGWGCTHSRLIRGGQKSYRSLKSMENFYVFLGTASSLSETLCQRALSACSAHLQALKSLSCLEGGGSCEDPHELLEWEKAQCPFLLPGDAKGRTCWFPCRDPLMRSPEHLQELLDMNLFSKNNL